jgi:hypothetical protein
MVAYEGANSSEKSDGGSEEFKGIESKSIKNNQKLNFLNQYNKMGYHENKKVIDACLKCAALCNHCAAFKCIQHDMECAALCYATAQLLSLESKHAAAIAKLCAALCEECATECGKHENEHCKECASACKECSIACMSI